jgi:hypothetical protein
MICPVEIAHDLSAWRAAKVGDHAKHDLLPEGRSGAGDESAGSDFAGYGEEDYLVSSAEIIGISQSCSKDVKSAMEAIILEVDEIVVKPIEIKQLAGMVRERLRIRKPANRTGKERVSDILHRRSDFIVQNWPVNWTTLRFRIASGLAIFPNW